MRSQDYGLLEHRECDTQRDTVRPTLGDRGAYREDLVQRHPASPHGTPPQSSDPTHTELTPNPGHLSQKGGLLIGSSESQGARDEVTADQPARFGLFSHEAREITASLGAE